MTVCPTANIMRIVCAALACFPQEGPVFRNLPAWKTSREERNV